jgi:hypothetical protein
VGCRERLGPLTIAMKIANRQKAPSLRRKNIAPRLLFIDENLLNDLSLLGRL